MFEMDRFTSPQFYERFPRCLGDWRPKILQFICKRFVDERLARRCRWTNEEKNVLSIGRPEQHGILGARNRPVVLSVGDVIHHVPSRGYCLGASSDMCGRP